MRLLAVGALGEVGREVSDALTVLGHDVIRVSSRLSQPHGEICDPGTARALISDGAVEAVINMSGPGDRREAQRNPAALTAMINAASEISGTPAILVSTTRVLEDAQSPFLEYEYPQCHTPYAAANARHEAVFRESAPEMASILRISNFFGAPQSASSPQSQLLPWSLVMEAVKSGCMTVRSHPLTQREFVSADDVARALMVLVREPPNQRVCATVPGLTMTLSDIAQVVQHALADANLEEPTAAFGNAASNVGQCKPGWLHRQGWRSELTPGDMTRVIAGWVRRVDLD